MIALCFVVVAFPVWALVGGLIVKGAVALANKVLGRPIEPPAGDWDDDNWYDPEPRPPQQSSTVPTPTFFTAVGFALALGVVNFGVVYLVVLGLQALGQEYERSLTFLIAVPLCFLADAGLLVPMLPSTFPRACLVAGFTLLMSALTGALLWGVMLLALMGLLANLVRQ